MGKGSKQRPTDHKKYSSNFDAIFGKKPKKDPKKKPPTGTTK
jgi:hypothetical protein